MSLLFVVDPPAGWLAAEERDVKNEEPSYKIRPPPSAYEKRKEKSRNNFIRRFMVRPADALFAMITRLAFLQLLL